MGGRDGHHCAATAGRECNSSRLAAITHGYLACPRHASKTKHMKSPYTKELYTQLPAARRAIYTFAPRPAAIWGSKMRIDRSQNGVVCGVTAAACAFSLAAPMHAPAADAAANASACKGDDSGLKLPAGFCATIFADGIGHARHLAVADSGIVYVNTWSGRYYGGATPPSRGFFVALKGTNGCVKTELHNAFSRPPANSGRRPHRRGLWRSDAKKTSHVFSPAGRYARGTRNREGFGVDALGHRIFVTQHGRDQLHTNWPEIIKDPEQEATLPSEEVLLLKQGGDYGWPLCYHDPFLPGLVLAPEYGGDGKTAGACAQKIPPTAYFPPHCAPNAMVPYDQKQFPAHYRQGLFIAFHGSWNRV